MGSSGGLIFIAAAVMAASAATMIHSKNVDCTEQIEKMQPCLAFVENQVSIPGSDCCKALLSVHLNSPVCLCKLLSSSSSMSSPAGVNVSSAMLLPSICDVHTNASRCPGLLAGAPEPSDGNRKASSEDIASGSQRLVWSWMWSTVAAVQILFSML
ncbi:lipid transfer-like protein VAS [Selaginella moellendorffii]|uniref:lipid transfer-like protein VAS n=1 Tax=Selaginella moellendorffii TaxID=88036 RepID=UPI000D1C3D9D|nr:lipid transfer-like protein VAS [Selaginella moellendorffii]|eukprot:XP_024525886.1 lipid transfer-like protein VAS [Selaginella moellendorffii]